ncbi:MAG TPA: hypothetical protein VHR55_12395 [Candidatus Limnocylindria bacterium]|nr:hypothetical protein [Candidatus Limnocylindria bacterium]
MSDAERARLQHVVLPRPSAGASFIDRYLPAPADNLLDAELGAFAAAGDTVLDPWAGTGWTARRAIAHGMRAVAADASPFAQLAAVAYLAAPDTAVLDAAFAQLAASRRIDVPLRQHIEELYASRCAACRRPVVVDQFIWPRDADAPGRKIYRCAGCEAALGGPSERVAPVDEVDLAKLGIEGHEVPPDEAEPDAVPEPAVAFEDPDVPLGEPDAPLGEPDVPLGEGGEPPAPPRPSIDPPTGGPRYASTVRPEPVPVAAADGLRQSPQYVELRARFPVLDGRDDLVEEVLGLYTPRNLYALHAIGAKIDTEIRDVPTAAVMRLALAACLLPASRLNGYPGRVASLRIAGGHVRQPASRHQRELNVWRAFEEAYLEVRDGIARTDRGRAETRFAGDFGELGGIGAANVLWLRSRPAVVGQYVPADGVDFVLSALRPQPTIDELSFEYLATAWVLGREAAETLRLEPIFGGGHADGVEATALRHGLTSAAGALKPGGWCSLLLDDGDPERLLTVALAATAAGLELVDVIHRESARSGDGIVLHLRRRSGEDRLREAVRAGPLRLGAEGGHLTYPELAAAIDRAAGALLRDRGEPAGLTRIVAAIVDDLARTGLLARLAHTRGSDEGPGDRIDGGGPALIASLVHEELWRDDHPTLVRIGDERRPMWWLRNPELAERPLADRVEWATWSVLSTAGSIDEEAFFDRIHRLFPGLQAPDEELVRACLESYAIPGERGGIATGDELAARSADHARVLATLVDYGHRLGLRTWIAAREHDRPHEGAPLVDTLTDEERRVYLPLVVRAPAEALGAVDALWYVRGRLAFLFEVEWTAMVGEAVLDRGRAIPVGEQQARFLVIPAERAELLRLKLSRSPWLRAEIERQNWHVLKWQHLDTLAARPGARLEWLEPVLGLDPLIERGGEQLTMFGE